MAENDLDYIHRLERDLEETDSPAMKRLVEWIIDHQILREVLHKHDISVSDLRTSNQLACKIHGATIYDMQLILEMWAKLERFQCLAALQQYGEPPTE